MWWLYQAVYAALLLLAAPLLLLFRGRHYRATVPGRLGLQRATPIQRSEKGGIQPLWFHAVSVGETMVGCTVIRALDEGLPVLLTTITPTGQAQAKRLLADRATTAYLPFDIGFAIRRFFQRHTPRALVLVEGDYWPHLLSHARRRRLPVVVVNGRVGDRSFRRMMWLRPLARRLFAAVDRFGVQTEQDRQRLKALGVPAENVVVTGNLKYESAPPKKLPELETLVTRLAGRRAILVAGSTMRGEEDAVLDAFRRVGADRALLVIAPRHPERFDEVAKAIQAGDLTLARRSSTPTEDPSNTSEHDGRTDVLLLDTLGELASTYGFATAAFIGGTLVPTGGHNPLEAARFGIPVAVGPSMENFRQMAEDFDHEGAWTRVGSAEVLAATWHRWIDDPEAARAVGEAGRRLIDKNRGALAATVELLSPLLERSETLEATSRLDATKLETAQEHSSPLPPDPRPQ